MIPARFKIDGFVLSVEDGSIRSADRPSLASNVFFHLFLIGREGEVVEAQMVETEDPLTGRFAFALQPYDRLARERVVQARRDSLAAVYAARRDHAVCHYHIGSPHLTTPTPPARHPR